MSKPFSHRWRGSGFTLIELLVAITIFAILGVLAYGGYNTSAKQSAIARERMARLKDLQNTVRLITQDFEQLAPRPMRDVLGDVPVNALSAKPDPEYLVRLTRSGWSNPAGVQRSTQQRVAYVLDREKGVLRRDHWTVLDGTLSNKPMQRELLKDVTAVRFVYIDAMGQKSEQWPPPILNVQMERERARPIGVELTLELKDFGTITRLIEIGR